MVDKKSKIFSSSASEKRSERNKKAQMKIQQMAFMLIAVMIFFALVGMLILTVKFSGLKGRATDLAAENAVLLVAKMANSPEFSCGESFGVGKISCIDSDKIMALKKNIEKYETFWGVSNVEIIKIYPPYEEPEICELGVNYPDCNTIRLISGEVKGIYAGNFVALCRKEFNPEAQDTYNKCELARVLVSYEEVK